MCSVPLSFMSKDETTFKQLWSETWRDCVKVPCDPGSSAVELPLLGTSVTELEAGVAEGILFVG